MCYEVMQENEYRMAQLAGTYRTGQGIRRAASRLMARAWRWCANALARESRHELIAERA
jgi:hypothetical protein